MEAANRLHPVTCELWLPRGPDLACEVLSVRGSEALSRPFELDIEIWCDEPDAPLASLLGVDAELLLERSGLERRIYGIVGELEVQLAVQGRSEREGVGARLKLVPAFRLLAHEVETRFFGGQTVVEILSTLLGGRLGAYERGVDVESHLTGTYLARDYCVQFRESTFDFCSRLMEEEGIAYLFEPDLDEQRERMVLVDANEHYAAAELLVGGPLPVECDRPEQLERESVQALALQHAIASNRVLARGYNYKLATPVHEGEATLPERRKVLRSRAHVGQTRQIIDDPLGDPDAQSFDGSSLDQQVPLARRVLDSLRSEAGFGRGRANAIGFAAGTTFELEQALPDGTRALLLTRAVHHLRREAGARGCTYHVEFECIPRAQPFRPRRSIAKPRVQGVQTGIVIGKQPDEVHTDRLGRVQVTFPLDDRAPSHPEASSCWIRVAQVWAGQGYGALVIPRVGMEVVVAFVDGDPDQPLITGCVYNATNQPPHPLPEELSRSTFKSSSSPGGEHHSELRIEDAAGSEQVFVRAQRRMDLRVAGTLYETATGGLETRVGAPSGGPEPYTTVDARTVLGDVHRIVLQEQRTEIYGKTSRLLADTVEVTQGHAMTRVEGDHKLNAVKVITQAQESISHKADDIVMSASIHASIAAGERLVLASNNALELRVGNSFISIHQAGIDIHGDLLCLNSGGGAGQASSAESIERFELARAYEALAADDGRPGGGGGGGGSGGRRSRDRGTISFEPLSPSPMTPPKPQKPKSTTTDEDAIGHWLAMRWKLPEVYCSEPIPLEFETLKVPPDVHQLGSVTDATSGDVIDGFSVVAGGERFEQTITISDVLPRVLPDGTTEAARDIHGKLDDIGLVTEAPTTLRFLSDLPAMLFRDPDGTFFGVSLQGHRVVINHRFPFVRAWMREVVALGNLAPEGAGGIIADYTAYGHSDWRYARRTYPSGTLHYEFWDGEGWKPVPPDFMAINNVLNTRVDQFVLWREGSVLKQNIEVEKKYRWPDTVPMVWADASNKELQKRLREMATAINNFWTSKVDLRRDQCAGYDPDCCRYPVEFDISFVEVLEPTQASIFITENDIRANWKAWSLINKTANEPLSDRTAIHEFGHTLGNGDEYQGSGSVNPLINGDGADKGIDQNSIMGSGTIARRRHFNTIAKGLAWLVEQRTGKRFTFTPVDP